MFQNCKSNVVKVRLLSFGRKEEAWTRIDGWRSRWGVWRWPCGPARAARQRRRAGHRRARDRRGGTRSRAWSGRPSGFDAGASTADLEAGLAPVLQTPEAYLRARGVTFDVSAGKPPGEPTPDHFVTVKPVRLLWIDPVRLDPARRVRHEGEVEVEGV